jgi:hypothetical protein
MLPAERARWRGRSRRWSAAAAGAYLLVTHTGHVLGALPYLLLLACPLMHVLSHRHGSGKHHGDGAKKK